MGLAVMALTMESEFSLQLITSVEFIQHNDLVGYNKTKIFRIMCIIIYISFSIL